MRVWAIAPLLALTASCTTLLQSRPHDFDCHGLLAGHVEDHTVDPVTLAIHRDAGGDDPDPRAAAEAIARIDDTASPLIAAALKAKRDEGPQAMLLLSGGGQWGAFGAGFLSALYGTSRDHPYDLITGISTGAIQGLFAATGDWTGMKDEYTIGEQSEIAIDKGDFGLVSMGANYDTAPLRQKLHDYLCAPKSGCEKLLAIGRRDAATLFVGAVRAADGKLQIVNLTRLIADGLAQARSPDDIEECVTGLVMASAAVPAQLRPVRIDKVTYVDGGVRASVFAGVATQELARSGGPASTLDVIRNGPTIVFRNRAKHPSDPPPVDAKPTVLAVGKQSYATIVNQTEVSSIALLRLLYPNGTIRVMTADGFHRVQGCNRTEQRAFDPDFMKCLIAWGEAKAAHGKPDWIELRERAVAAPAGVRAP